MAGIEIKGFQELVRNCNYLSKEVLEKALQAAEDAAAQVVRQAVESAAPRKIGQLAESMTVFEGIDRKALSGSPR
jgi:cyanophycinase-like exopeptidase